MFPLHPGSPASSEMFAPAFKTAALLARPSALRAAPLAPLLRAAVPSRHLSSSRLLLATHAPQTGPTKLPSGSTVADLGSNVIPGGGKANEAAQWNNEVAVDYSKGPSALDKASRLFFFTEILRGESALLGGDRESLGRRG